MALVIHAPISSLAFSTVASRDFRIVFFGTPAFAVPALRALVQDGWPIAAVVTAPDKPVGRRAVLTPSPVKEAATELQLDIFEPKRLGDITQELSDLQPDLGVVVAYGKIIPQSILDLFPKGVLNIHPSLLPAYRGPSPIQTAILDGCSTTGISLMALDAEMDHGPVLAQESWDIPSGFDAEAVTDELARLGANLLVRTLPGYLDGTVVPQPQDHSKATVTHKFTRDDGRLDWQQSAQQLHNRVRALGKNPGTWTLIDEQPLNIYRTRVLDDAQPPQTPGTVLSADGYPAVACRQGVLVLESVQLSGGRAMEGDAFLRGRPSFVGTVLK